MDADRLLAGLGRRVRALRGARNATPIAVSGRNRAGIDVGGEGIEHPLIPDFHRVEEDAMADETDRGNGHALGDDVDLPTGIVVGVDGSEHGRCAHGRQRTGERRGLGGFPQRRVALLAVEEVQHRGAAG